MVIDLMGRTPIEYGLYFGMVSLGYIVGNFLSGRWVMKYGPQRMIRAGTTLAIASVLLMAFLYALNDMQPAFLFLPTMLLGMGNGLVLPSCIAGAVSVKPEIAGAASGLAGSLQIGLGAITAPLVGALVSTSAWPMIITIGVCTVTAASTMTLVSRR